MKTYKVAGDGQCLFNSIAFGILHNLHGKNEKPSGQEYKPLASSLRKICTDKMTELVNSNHTETIEILAASVGEFRRRIRVGTNLKSKAYIYISHMKQKTTWGGYIEINILGDYIKSFGFKGIKVLDDNKNEIAEMQTSLKNNNPNIVLHLILSGVEVGGLHFNYIDVETNNSNSNSNNNNSNSNNNNNNSNSNSNNNNIFSKKTFKKWKLKKERYYSSNSNSNKNNSNSNKSCKSCNNNFKSKQQLMKFLNSLNSSNNNSASKVK